MLYFVALEKKNDEIFSFVTFKQHQISLEKTADISQPQHHWLPREMTSGKRAQKFHSDEYVRHYPDLRSAYDWLKQISHAPRPISNTTQIRVVTRHQYGISALVSPGPRHFTRKPVVFSDYIKSESHHCTKTI